MEMATDNRVARTESGTSRVSVLAVAVHKVGASLHSKIPLVALAVTSRNRFAGTYGFTHLMSGSKRVRLAVPWGQKLLICAKIGIFCYFHWL